MSIRYRIVDTPFGPAAFVISHNGLRRIHLPQCGRNTLHQLVRDEFPLATEDASLAPSFADAFREYFRGGPAKFDMALDTEGATAFERKTWRACRDIPAGRTLSYKELATKIGKPGAARAVGAAMAHNRFPIVVPCHRVLRSDGGLGGFSAVGGVDLKRRLLEMESRARDLHDK